MRVEALFDPRTWTLTYLVWDEATRDAVVIDPVLDYDPLRVRVYDESLGKLEAVAGAHGLNLLWSLETHAHADHISAGARLRRRHGLKLAIGAPVTRIQATFRRLVGLPDDFPVDGSQFDRLLDDGDVLEAGSLRVEALATPGHTPACFTYRVGDALFTGDALFMPDSGTGRCDFPNGSAADLYESLQRLYRLPDETRVFVGHDYQPGGRALAYETTVGASRRENIQVKAATSKEDYVRLRTARDAQLNPPNLIFQSIQCNLAGGDLPPPDAEGRRFLKLPVGLFGDNA